MRHDRGSAFPEPSHCAERRRGYSSVMHPGKFFTALSGVALLAPAFLFAASSPRLPGVGAALQQMVDRKEIAGAVTMVVSAEKILHQETTGFADLAAAKPMQPDTMFWIASMTKPITGVAIMMLQDEGKLRVTDPVAKFIPEFAALKTPSGRAANLTLTQVLTHTSGLGEASAESARAARTLADLTRGFLAAPMQFEPGERWKYCQSGINTAARVVEIVSGVSFDVFVAQRITRPLGMKHTTFYPTAADQSRLVTAYARNKDTGALEPVAQRPDYGTRDRPPQGNGGLYSTAPDYARFCQMLLNRGVFEGRRYLSEAAFKTLTTPQTGNLPTGFFQTEALGQRGADYGWGIATAIQRRPHDGMAMLSPGTFGHGGAWGTQAWVDPVRGVAYVLMVQRSNFPNSDASEVRRVFQQAAVDGLKK